MTDDDRQMLYILGGLIIGWPLGALIYNVVALVDWWRVRCKIGWHSRMTGAGYNGVCRNCGDKK